MIRVDGEEHAWHEGMTVADLLNNLKDSDHYAVVRINKRHVSRPNFKKELVPDNAEVFLIPLVAGG